MTILYKPVKIESAEQAEALPIGTVTINPEEDLEACVKIGAGRWFGTHGDARGYPDRVIVGDTALVLIEAEEETKAERLNRVGDPRWQESTRLVTPWEEA